MDNDQQLPAATDLHPPPGEWPSLRSADGRCAAQQLISRHRLRVVYQPIVDLRHRRTFAYEALTRSDAPGSSGPRELFDRAVCAGCAGVLGRAVRQLASTGAPDLPLFVNVHPKELGERWLWQADDPVYHHGPAIHLEITESAPLGRLETCRSLLEHLRARRIEVAIDDLGSGFSNLSHLAILRPRFAKLDRSLVRGLTRRSRLFLLIRGLVQLCEDLDIEVIAEGIETEAEAEAIVEAGAPYGQGYLFARPAYPVPAVSWPERLVSADSDVAPTCKAAPKSHVRVRGSQSEADDDPAMAEVERLRVASR
ncbi:MAG: EAL domain-containing protein [Deltaproteobacteria bacterium]|jgi:EAL domain-containing protein (putative c-di-GMP-specific phosphodiesterase class I)|nr:EAL domain-containing protein [Deltaproteobacteria bacterium]MBW2536493.1 EAL domain-containing protein [Deltaproteobacteria bacterium]